MYAHDLIEDMSNSYLDGHYNEVNRINFKKLKNAQHFYLGPAIDFWNFCGNLLGSIDDPYFVGPLGIDISLPFDSITIQFDNSQYNFSESDIKDKHCPKKTVVLISQFDNNQVFQISRFNKHHGDNVWSLDVFTIEIDMSCPHEKRFLIAGETKTIQEKEQIVTNKREAEQKRMNDLVDVLKTTEQGKASSITSAGVHQGSN